MWQFWGQYAERDDRDKEGKPGYFNCSHAEKQSFMQWWREVAESESRSGLEFEAKVTREPCKDCCHFFNKFAWVECGVRCRLTYPDPTTPGTFVSAVTRCLGRGVITRY